MPAARQYLVRDPETGDLVWSDSPAPPTPTRDAEKPWISDSLGFVKEDLPKWEEDRKRHNFSAVEFIDDPMVPGFCQVKIDGKRAREEYIAHRQKFDKARTLGGGQVLAPEAIEQAEELVKRGPSTPVLRLD